MWKEENLGSNRKSPVGIARAVTGAKQSRVTTHERITHEFRPCYCNFAQAHTAFYEQKGKANAENSRWPSSDPDRNKSQIGEMAPCWLSDESLQAWANHNELLKYTSIQGRSRTETTNSHRNVTRFLSFALLDTSAVLPWLHRDDQIACAFEKVAGR